MFPPYEDVPGYPLVFVIFWGSALFFVLVMLRHLRVFAVARPSRPFANVPARVVGLVEYAFVQTKMFKDPGAAVMHAGIFWGFVLLTIGTADIVTGGIIQTVLKIPADGIIWALVSAMQNAVAVIVLAAIAWAYYRRLVVKPRRLTLNRDALLILGMIGGVVATELFAQFFQVAAHGDIPGAFVSNAVAVPLRNLSPDVLQGIFTFLWWAHIALVAAFLCYLPFSKHLHIATAFPNIFFRKLAPRGELPKLDLEDENATFGLKTLAGPRLEGPARRVHLHRVRPLPGGLPRLQHRQAAQPQGTDHGHPPHVGERRARHRHHPELADRARDVRPR